MSGASSLNAKDFASYPPLAKELAVAHLGTLRQLPIAFAAVLLGELIGYDWHFPAERAEMDLQLRMLSGMSSAELAEAMAGFRAIVLPHELDTFPWVAQPAAFVERLTAYLWTVHAVDNFRQVALGYGARLDQARRPAETDEARFCAVAIGRGARGSTRPLFAKLRPHGSLFTQVDATNGLSDLLGAVEDRARTQPTPYAHWYVDGGTPEVGAGTSRADCTILSYQGLEPMRSALLRRMQDARSSPTVGPEQLRSLMEELGSRQMNSVNGGTDEILGHFQLSLFTEGSGTQIFSTTFVQWAGREILRRAQPRTLLLRYAPRQVDRPMNDLLLGNTVRPEVDPEGSLVDADMGAYYTWINLSRISPLSKATFIAWFEEGTEVMVIAPGMPRGTVSTQPCTIRQVLQWIA